MFASRAAVTVTSCLNCVLRLEFGASMLLVLALSRERSRVSSGHVWLWLILRRQ